MFDRVAKKLDLAAIEPRILAFWKESRAFERLVERNAQGKPWSFYDGPITANNKMGVHHAWGRTYKDIFQRYQAMQGMRQRYQNGFDCQGLWVEVEVEKDLGLNSKREILSHGLDRFSAACKARVERYSAVQTEQSIRLGQWMDWEHSYYTHTDANISYIWHFLKACDGNKWLYQGHRPMPWCVRCGTSLSQHELIDSYKDVVHRSVYLKLPVKGRSGHFLCVWTTTPWTLLANVALAVNPDLDYALVKSGSDTLILSKGTLGALGKSPEVVGTLKGRELVGWEYEGPFDDLPAQKGSSRRVVPWEMVGEAEGTGIVHIAPGCGAEDFELSKKEKLPAVIPIDESGIYAGGFGPFEGKEALKIAHDVFERLKAKGMLIRIQDVRHRYPACWRCGEELVFRLVDEWFIRCDEIRPRMKEAAAGVKWTPEHIGKRMQDWLDNMGDWNISRKRFWGLPLPFYVCECGERNIVGSRKELREWAVDPAKVDALPELHRPWIDDIQVYCQGAKCKGKRTKLSRVPEVGDCWLDAGIIPFSTLKYPIPGIPGDRAYWETWFPAELVCEMREQVRLWFYSTLFMAVTLERRAPYKAVLAYEKVYDEKGRPMHKSAGNAIWFDEAAEKMGADVMRWMYAAAPIETNLRFGYGPADEVRRKLLTLWNVYAFFVEYANLDKPDLSPIQLDHPGLTELDRWILWRLTELEAIAATHYDLFLTQPIVAEAERFLDDLSNWYLRRSRARFWKEAKDADKAAAYATLYGVLITTCQVLAPILPFLAEEIWRNLRRGRPELPESVHLTRFPEAMPFLERGKALLEEMKSVQQVVRLGHAARAEAKLRVRQPLAACRVAAPADALWRVVSRHKEMICDELNVRGIEKLEGAEGLIGYKVRPNLPRLGKRLGKKIGALQKALAAADPADVVRDARAGGWKADLEGEPIALSAEDLLIDTVRKGETAAAEGNGFVVALETRLTPDLVNEGYAREMVHLVQGVRKELDLPYETRIDLFVSADSRLVSACRAHDATLRRECLIRQIDWEGAPRDAKEAEVEGLKLRFAVEPVQG